MLDVNFWTPIIVRILFPTYKNNTCQHQGPDLVRLLFIVLFAYLPEKVECFLQHPIGRIIFDILQYPHPLTLQRTSRNATAVLWLTYVVGASAIASFLYGIYFNIRSCTNGSFRMGCIPSYTALLFSIGPCVPSCLCMLTQKLYSVHCTKNSPTSVDNRAVMDPPPIHQPHLYLLPW